MFAVNKKQVVMFGGVVDHEKDRGEIIVSEFYNETYTFQVAKPPRVTLGSELVSLWLMLIQAVACTCTAEPAQQVTTQLQTTDAVFTHTV